VILVTVKGATATHGVVLIVSITNPNS